MFVHKYHLELVMTCAKEQQITHGPYYFAEFIFPDFPGQNESFSLTNLFKRNTNVGFQSLLITLKTRAKEQIQKWTQK